MRAKLILKEKMRGNVGLVLPNGEILWFHVDYENELRKIRDTINGLFP